jgi:hypothetical protein
VGMESYTHSGNSGVIAFAIGRNHIDVQFVDGHVYRYAPPRLSRAELDEMIERARRRRGLATFISQNIKDRYVKKWRGKPPRGAALRARRRTAATRR